jgi:hypothetical protein
MTDSVLLSEYRRTIENLLQQIPREVSAEELTSELAKPWVDELARRRGRSMSSQDYAFVVRQRLEANLDARRPHIEITFPQFWRRFFVVAVMSAFEDHTDVFCQALRESRGLRIGWKELWGSVLDRLHSYAFKLAALPSPPPWMWEQARWLEQIRDCIIHVNGEVGRSRDAGTLRALTGKFPGYAVDERGYIQLKEEGGEFALGIFRNLFLWLYLQADLPGSEERPTE